MKIECRKLGGWLLFFVIIHLVGAVQNFNSARIYFSAAGIFYKAIGFLVLLIASGTVIMVGRLLRRKPDFIIYLYATSALLILVNLLSVGSAPYAVFTVIGNVARLVLWALYFKKSERVAVYFAAQEQCCMHCGAQLAPGAQFCGKCGKSL